MDVIGVEAAGFIGASVTLILVIVFMILMVILVRQCLQYVAKRGAIREQTLMQQSQAERQVQQRRRLSVTEPVPATFDWHHSIRVEGTPPPTYIEAEELPALEKIQNKSIHKYDSFDEKIEQKLIEDTKVTNSGMTPLISNDLERNRSNTISRQEPEEVAIAVEPSVIQSPRSTGIAPTPQGSQEHSTTMNRESPEGEAEFSTAYTQYVAP